MIELVAAGLVPKDLATRLNRSPATIRNHLYAGMKKVGIRSRYELVHRFRPAPPSLPVEIECLEYAI